MVVCEKLQKSQLLKCLEPYARSLDEGPPHSVQILDGMVILQQLPPELASFGHISDHILHRVTMEQSRIIFFVTDRYLPSSIKSNEREVRGNLGTIQVKVERRDRSRPKQFKKFLADELFSGLVVERRSLPYQIPPCQRKWPKLSQAYIP